MDGMSDIEDADKTPAERAAEVEAEALARMQRSPEEVKAGVDPANVSGGDKNFSPISASEMRGDPVMLIAGSQSIWVHPLCRRDIRQSFLPGISQWPELIQFAATTRSPIGSGIDYEATARLMTAYARGSDPNAAEITPEDVAGDVELLADTITDYDSAILSTLRLFRPLVRSKGEDCPMDDVQMTDFLDSLHLCEFADLLRGLKRALGSYRGSVSDRFTKP